MHNSMNKYLSTRLFHSYGCSRTIRNGQRGALLITVIIAMIILSSLGGAMVYFFSSSVLDPVFSNFSQRAYYAAESGMRYAVSMYRNSSPLMAKDQFINLLNTGGGTIITFVNNGEAKLTARDNGGGGTPTNSGANAQTIATGGSLTVESPSNFPATNGFFQITGRTGYFRYKEKSGNNLQMISGPGLPFTVDAGTVITSPADQVSVTSKGFFPLAGIFGMSRTVQYGWVLSGTPPGGPAAPPLLDLPNLVANNPFGNSADLGRFVTENVGGLAITVAQTTGGNAEAVLGYSGSNPDPFLVAWQNAGNFLSYDMQIKIATGVWDGAAFDKTSDGTNSVASKGYIAGLTFRSKGTNPGQWQQYGLDFAKYNQANNNFQPTMSPKLYPTRPQGTYGTGDTTSVSTTQAGKTYYTNYKCNATCTVAANGDLAGWGDPYNPPMILLWTRNTNQSSGDDHWLAFKLLDEDEPNDGIVNASGFLKDWSTLLVRVVEGASLRFNSNSTGFQVGDIVTGAGGATGKVIKKIQQCNSAPCPTATNASGSKDVIILNNVVDGPGNTTFVSGELISSPGRSTIANDLYRARDNYIWAMFGDTSAQSNRDGIALNETRGANARIVDDSIVTNENKNCYIHWPEMNIEPDWGNDIIENCSTPLTVKNDYFKLVPWNANLNPAFVNTGDQMLIMGTGKEAGAVLRTSRWTTGGAPYTTGTFPYEVGFHSLGDTATKTHFDDVAINFPGQTVGGIPYITPIQQ